ncbi:MAG: Gfo/Idh/MocA family oxidoreductase, partial [Verrucomicrobiota bacterium]
LWENAFTGYVDMGERWNSQPSVSGGGVLIDNGTHSLDLARFFLGPIDALRVSEGKRTQGLPVEETVQITFQSRSGSMGTIDLSWTINKQLPTYITIHGSEGTLSLGWKESKYRNHQDEEWTVFGQGYSKVGAFVNQIENMANAILGKEDLLITIDDGLASIRAIEAAYIALSQAPSAIQEEPSLGEGIFRVELEGKPRETL